MSNTPAGRRMEAALEKLNIEVPIFPERTAIPRFTFNKGHHEIVKVVWHAFNSEPRRPEELTMSVCGKVDFIDVDLPKRMPSAVKFVCEECEVRVGSVLMKQWSTEADEFFAGLKG